MSWVRGVGQVSSAARLLVCAAVLCALIVTFGVSSAGSIAAATGLQPTLPHSWAVPNGGVPVRPAEKSGFLPGSGQVSPSGAFTYELPFKVPDGRMGMAPAVGLRYSSGGGDGPLGLGWAGTWDSRITRCGATPRVDGTRGGVRFDEGDRFCLDGQRLVNIGGIPKEYRTEMDSFARVRAVYKPGTPSTSKTGPDEFEVYGKDGRIRTYRAVETVRFSPASVQLTNESVDEENEIHRSSTHIEQRPYLSAPEVVWVWWELVSDRDRTGNTIRYEYQNVGSVADWGFERVVSQIRYTYGPGRDAARSVKFIWQDRDDPSSSYMAGVQFGLTKRLERVEMYAPNPAATGLVRTYQLSYLPMTGTGARSRSMLAQVQECADRNAERCMPAKQFTWSESSMPSFTTTSLGFLPAANPWPSMPGSMALRVGDYNGDGADDITVNPGGYMATDRIRLGRRDAVTGKVAPLADGWELTGQGDWPGEGLAQPACPDLSLSDDATTINYSDCPSENIVTHARELDVDGDGTSEIVIQVRLTPAQTPQRAKTLVLRWDAGAHTFLDTGLEFPIGYINDWQDFIDVNGDGRLDRVFSRPVLRPGTDPHRQSDPKVSVQLNKDGQFAAPVDSDVNGACAHMASDVDGDGRGDLLLEKAWERPNGELECGMGQGTDALLVNDAGEITVSPGGEGHAPFVKGGGWTYPFLTPQESGTSHAQTRYENDLGQYRSFRGDFNGDGLQDVLAIGRDLPWDGQAKFGTGPLILWNTGTGLVYDEDAPRPKIESDFLAELRIGDFDGDGRDDVASFYSTGLRWINEPGFSLGEDPGAVERISLYISDGRGTFRSTTMNSGAGRTQSDGSEYEWARPLTQLGDFNGDGLLDIVKKDDELRVMTQDATVPDRIIKVRDEGLKNAQLEVMYSHDWTDQPHKFADSTEADQKCGGRLVCLRRGMPVVRQVNSHAQDFTTDNFAPTSSVYYSYGDPVADTQDGMIGFGIVREWRPDQPSETITTYDVRVRREGYHPFAHHPKTVRTAVPITAVTTEHGTATVRVQETTSAYEFRALHCGLSHAVFPQSSNTQIWETSSTINWNPDLTGAASEEHIALGKKTKPFREVSSNSTYDDYGNLTRSESTVLGGTKDVLETKYELPDIVGNPFDPAQQRVTDWLISIPDYQEHTRSEADRSPAPTPAAVKRTTDFTTDARGRRTGVTTEPGSPNEVSQTFDLDPTTGVVASVTTATAGMPDRVTHTDYRPSGAFPGEPDEWIYPSQTWAEHPTPEYRPSSWQVVQPGYGVVVATMDANGVSTGTSIDTLGRPVQAVGDMQPTVHYSYSGHHDAAGFVDGSLLTTTTATDLTGGGQVNTTSMVTDQLGRTRISRITGFDGKLINTSTKYNLLGQLESQSRPAPNGGTSPGITSYRYDPLGRVTSIVSPDNTTSSWTYPTPFTTETTDPRGHQTNRTVDVDGRVVKTGTRYSKGAVARRTITYAPFDLAETVTDDRGNVTTSAYDVYGRPIKIIDPDRGTVTATYTGTGEVLTRTHVKSQDTSTFNYEDPLGRLTSTIDHDHGANTDATTRFTWDSVPHGVGQLATAVSPDDITTSFEYDTLGRTHAETITDGATNISYRVGTEYDAIGRPSVLRYPTPEGKPSPFAIKTEYTKYGHLKAILNHPSGAALLTVTARNADMALTDATLGPLGAVNPIQLKRDYDPETGQLTSLDAGKGVLAPTLLNLTYTYDDDGAVDTRTQTGTAGARTEKYHYDEFHRLTGWDLTTDATHTSTTTYSYDSIGNLTHIANSSGATPTQDLLYPTNGIRPHAMDEATNPNGHGYETYQYDDHGRETRVLDKDGNTLRKTIYTPFDLPKKVTDKKGESTTFAYDAFGTRVKETGPQDTTFTVPGLFQTRTDKNGKTKYVYFIDGVGQAVGDGTKRPEIQYTIADNLGSTTAHLDEAGTLKQTYYTEPYGATINTDGTPRTRTPGDLNNRFTGHEHDDELRLINMNGRVYDPIKKAFLTPDPVTSNHPYSYVNSNPTNYTDPTGFDPCYPSSASCGDQDEIETPNPPAVNQSTYNPCDGERGCSEGKAISTGPKPGNSGVTGRARSDGTGTVTPGNQGGPSAGHPAGDPAVTVTVQGPPRASRSAGEITNPFAMALARFAVKIFCGAECSSANAPETADTPRVNSLTAMQHLRNAYVTATTIVRKPSETKGTAGPGGMGMAPGGGDPAADPGMGADPAPVGAADSSVGFSDDALSTAFQGMRNEGGHAIRHLREKGLIPNSGSLASQVSQFEQVTSPILRSPTKTFDWRIGGTASRAFAGVAGGRQVVVFVAKEGPYQGRVLSAIVPDDDQIAGWGLR